MNSPYNELLELHGCASRGTTDPPDECLAGEMYTLQTGWRPVFRCKVHGHTTVYMCRSCMPAWRKLGECPKCKESRKAKARDKLDQAEDDSFLAGVAVAWLL